MMRAAMSERETPDDDLLTPSLGHIRAEDRVPGDRPWRLGSQFYVGFFGGPLAITAIAFLNAGRLRMTGRERAAIALLGLACLLGVFLATVIIGGDTGTNVRLIGRVGGVVAAGLFYWLQKPANRRYSYRHDEDEFDSLWVPGLAAVIGLGLLENVIAAGLDGELS
jgi:hypothetical protein